MPPYKSEAQRKKFRELFEEGKISKETLDKFERETGDTKLPAYNRKNAPLTKRPKRVLK